MMRGGSVVIALVSALAVSTAEAGQKGTSSPKSASEADFVRVRALAPAEGGCRELSRKRVGQALGRRAPKDFVRASACVHAGGRAVSVVVVTSCGGDSCGTEGWLFTRARAFALPDADFDVTADAAAIVYTRLRPKKALGEYDVDVARRELASGAETSLARCASPVVSPGGKWVVCRTKTDGVLRVPVGGGAVERVTKGTGVVRSWVPYALEFPSAVAFPSAKEMAYWAGEKRRVRGWRE